MAESRHMFSMETEGICFPSSWKETRKLTESCRFALVKRRILGTILKKYKKELQYMAYKILIADDEPNIVKMLSDFFARKGYQILEAFSALRQIECTLDIILLDIKVPGLDGLEICGEPDH